MKKTKQHQRLTTQPPPKEEVVAKNVKLSLIEEIAKLELFVLYDLLPRFKQDAVRWTAELEDYLGITNGQCGGLLGALYHERNVAQFNQALAFNHASIEALALQEKIAEVECQALQLHKALADGKRVNLPSWQIDAIVTHLNVRLDHLAEQLYVGRQEALNRLEAERNVNRTLATIVGPEKLTSRSRDRVRAARKAVKARQDQAIRASMKGNEQGGTNRKKERAA